MDMNIYPYYGYIYNYPNFYIPNATYYTAPIVAYEPGALRVNDVSLDT
jgi:hypothetical protein